MRSPCSVIAATLAAGTLLLAQNPGNGKANGRGDHLVGAASPGGSGGAGTTLLSYNGGPVMLGQTHIYYIYYGNWSVDTKASGILNNFANNLTGSGYYNILTQYYSGSTPSYISNSVVLSGSATSSYVAANPTNLTDSDIFGIVKAAIGNNSLPLDANGVYFVLTAPGVGESSGFLTQYCGWHTAATINSTWIKYSFVGDAGNNSGCSVQFSSSPNNDPPVDAMITVLAHELSETVTDPLINAWYDTSGQEIGDKCAWNFGATFTEANGSTANITLGGFDFLIQQEFSNASDSCVMTYTATPDYTLSVSPVSQSAPPGGSTGNYTVTVNPANGFNSGVTLSVSGLPAGASASVFTPNPASTTSTFNISTGTAAPGTYALTITGTSGALSHNATATLVVAQPDFSLSVTPTSQSVVQGGTTGAYTVKVTPLNGFTGTPTLVVTGNPSGTAVNMTGLTFTVTTFTTTGTGSFPLTITGTSGSLQHSVPATLVVNPAGSFKITLAPPSQSVKRGSPATYTVTVTPSGGFNSSVTFVASGLPSKATANFQPPSVTGSGTSTLTITTVSNGATGTSTIKVTGTSGNLTASGTASLTLTK